MHPLTTPKATNDKTSKNPINMISLYPIDY